MKVVAKGAAPESDPKYRAQRIKGMTAESDLENLLNRVVLKDRAAFTGLYDLTCAKLFGVLLRILGNRSQAEDALKQVLVKSAQAKTQQALYLC